MPKPDVRVCGAIACRPRVQIGSQRPGPVFCTTRRGGSIGNFRCQTSGSLPCAKYSTNFLIFPYVCTLDLRSCGPNTCTRFVPLGQIVPSVQCRCIYREHEKCNLPCDKLPTSLVITFLEEKSPARIIKVESKTEVQ